LLARRSVAGVTASIASSTFAGTSDFMATNKTEEEIRVGDWFGRRGGSPPLVYRVALVVEVADPSEVPWDAALSLGWQRGPRLAKLISGSVWCWAPTHALLDAEGPWFRTEPPNDAREREETRADQDVPTHTVSCPWWDGDACGCRTKGAK
jgi:hypothetical protein